MVASIGKIASPAQGVSYFEKDGYYARDDAAHRDASAWAGRGSAALGLEGPVGRRRSAASSKAGLPAAAASGGRNSTAAFRTGRAGT